MPDCDYNCDSCDIQNCDSRVSKAKLNSDSSIKHVVAVLSGKGGVGKSYVTSLIAVGLARRGYSVGIMDADITGPSIPKSFGLSGMLYSDGSHILPAETILGIKVVSSNLLLQNAEDPIIWRGPMLSSLVRQFYEDVYWGDLDYLLIDMPPGTGDITLTVFQLLPIESLYIVTSPQDLVTLIVNKAINMSNQMNIPVKGIIENMSYISCPHCGERINLYGEGDNTSLKEKVITHIPLKSENAKKVDEGLVEQVVEHEIDVVIDDLTKE